MDFFKRILEVKFTVTSAINIAIGKCKTTTISFPSYPEKGMLQSPPWQEEVTSCMDKNLQLA